MHARSLASFRGIRAARHFLNNEQEDVQHEVRTIASKARGEFDDTKETWETFALMNIQLPGRSDS